MNFISISLWRYWALVLIWPPSVALTELSALAQTPAEVVAIDEPTPGDVTGIMIGAGVGYAPEFEGAADNEAVVLPLFRVADLFGFNLEPFALSYNLIDWRSVGRSLEIRAGPRIALDFGRDEDDSVILNGLGDVETAALAGAFVNLRAAP
jgi:outer membrane scaffolding protein for murein synthesis (MipA/OmpV family)